MLIATMTSKGQTTIPGAIRESLHLKASDKLIFIPDGDRVYIKTLPVNIVGLAGSFKRKQATPVDFVKLREAMKGAVAASLARGHKA